MTKPARRSTKPLIPGYQTAAMLIICCGLIGSTALAAPNGHLLDQPCHYCHLSASPNSSNASELIASQLLLCSGCHSKAVSNLHLLGSIARALPSNFPLDSAGEMNCSSCHEIHGRKPRLLRSKDSGIDFCLNCHPQAFFDTMRDQGASLLGAHIGLSTPNTGQPLDAISFECLTCHELLNGEFLVNPLPGGFVHDSDASSHPVGGIYTEAANAPDYRPASSLPDWIQLPEGMVSCASCHQTYVGNHGALVSNNDYSALCYACHKL